MQDSKGLYPKYVVFRHPPFDPVIVAASAQEFSRGFSPNITLEQVKDFCFVLKPVSDRHARVAVAAYAQSVMEDNPMLGEELMQIIADGPRK